MDACIARGGISHVLSQARASLKNPSRPFTPRTTGRSLFDGDDYRPGSRPSSSYSVVEQKTHASKEFLTRGDDCNRETAVGPTGSSLPPRPAAKKTTTTRGAAVPKPPPQVKLMHAPVVHDYETTDGVSSDKELSGEETEDTESHNFKRSQRAREEEDLLESSLEIPSAESLSQMLNAISSQLSELSLQPPSSIKRQGLESLSISITAFATSRAICLRGSASSRRPSGSSLSLAAAAPETVKVSAIRWRLFNDLVDLAIGPWHVSARAVVAIAPCILDLYQLGVNVGKEEDADSKIMALGKVLFVLSKESGNDVDFCNVRYVEAALGLLTTANARKAQQTKQRNCSARESPLKALIYITGTLKNISSGEDKMLKLLATNGAIATLSETLLWRSKDAAESKEIAQLLVQTTTILRNLSASKSYLKQFNESHVACRLCETISAYVHHQEVMVNVSRILGKLTLHEVPRAQINQHSERYVGHLLTLVDARTNPTLSFTSSTSSSANQSESQKSQDVLLVRIYFVLGNLCAGNDRNRRFVGVESDALPVLLQSFQHYGSAYVDLRQRQEQQLHHNDDGGPDSNTGGKLGVETITDVLVKLVRLIANMAMNAEVGLALNSGGNQLAMLLEVLECAQACGSDEELMLNIVSCMTNLSYYCTAPSTATPTSSSSSSFIDSHRLEIAAQLSQILWNRNEEAVLEAARAFGNLSRFKDVLRVMGENKVLDGFVILLDHSNREIVYTVCGVLMNAALDESSRAMLLDVRRVHSGAGDAAVIDARPLLVGILECAALDDIEMSCIAAKALYNLLLSKKDTAATGRYLASPGGHELQRIATSILEALRASESRDNGDEHEDGHMNHEAQCAELRGVLTQLQRSVERSDSQ